ncbi:ROK family protein [Gemmatimonas sp.]|uniref:ROK family protein n=1 Tax=Gemmatimonas sp. TaxID=1962908 RepID=UPI00286BCDF1|nr:ROK family protein [Gemmatimonas sp.]
MQIGIDLGGTKIEGIALDATGRELLRQRVATPRDYGETVAAITALVTALESAAGHRGTIGVGIPGAVIPDSGLVKNANSGWLIGQPLGADLAAALQREVRLDNDANCFALSEASDGAAAGAEVVFGVIMGTGVGGGIIVRGRGLSGPNLIAGEWGHNPLPWPQPDELPGPDCYCGKQGCIESWISGPAVAADHRRVTGAGRTTPDIIAAANAGHDAALATRARFVNRAARGLATVINVLDPDVIVLGGGLSNVPRLADDIAAQLPAFVFSDRVRTSVVHNRHGDSSGVRGAAWLWPAS